MMEVEFAKRPVDEWCERLQKAGIPYEKLATTEEVLEDPQCWENGYLHRHTFESGNEGVIFNTPVMFTEAPKPDRKSTRLNSSHANISYAVFCLKKKKHTKFYFSVLH